MKTTNNVQRTILTAFIILTGIAILNGNSSAQGFWGSLTDNNENPFAMKTDLNSGSNSASNLNSASFDYINLSAVEEESPLEIEDWMITDFNRANEKQVNEIENEPVAKEQGKKVLSTSTFVYRDIVEPALKFERWMFDPNHWKAE